MGHMTRHLKKHKPMQPMLRPIAPKKSTEPDLLVFQRQTLNYTLSSHNDEKDADKMFKCSHCDYTDEMCHLNQHLRKHNKSEWFKCSNCDFSTWIKEDLDRHLRKHNKDEWLKCSFCDYTTCDESNLTQHSKKHNKSE